MEARFRGKPRLPDPGRRHAMSRIGADHLAREAIVYVRQSTIDQVINN